MSGPKVTVVVTREEVIARCERDLARLDAAIAKWLSRGLKSSLIDEKDQQAAARRRESIASLLQSDQFLALQKQVPLEIEFLNAELKRRESEAISHRISERTRRRRLAETASTLIGALEAANTEVPSEVTNELQALSQGKTSADSAAINRALGLLTPLETADDLSAQARALADRLGSSEDTETLTSWIAQRPLPNDSLGEAIDRHIEELRLRDGNDAAEPYASRAQAAAREPSRRRRQLLFDSLLIELAQAAAHAEIRREVEVECAALLAELNALAGSDATAMARKLDSALVANDLEKLKTTKLRVEAFMAQASEGLANTARRRVVLRALSELGYEVREGMASAWVENGNIVLSHARRADAGVKLSGGTKGRIQFRAVRLGDESEASDVDLETLWCTDFAHLKESLQAEGSEIVVERQLPVGQVAVERAEKSADSRGSERRGSHDMPKTRRRPQP